jgi:hypothetical protein
VHPERSHATTLPPIRDLDVVKWLHENRTKRCTFLAIEYANGAGHLEVVE